MKTYLILAAGITACAFPALAIESSTAGNEGPKASVTALESKIDTLSAVVTASLNAILARLTSVETKVTALQGQVSSIISCGAQNAVFNGSSCIVLSANANNSNTNNSNGNNSSNNNTTGPTYSWTTGSWGNCSASLGGGNQSRTVYCNNASNSVVADSFCTDTKPAVSQSCNLQVKLVSGQQINCADTSAAGSIYKTYAGRCGEPAGIAYWNNSVAASGQATTIGIFKADYTKSCYNAYLVNDYAVCNNYLLCNTGFHYIANSTQCAKD